MFTNAWTGLFFLQSGFDPTIMIMVGVIFLLVVILPARKEKKLQAAMRAGLKKGDRVLTQAGMVGKVAKIEDELVTLEFNGAKIPFLLSTVVKVLDNKGDASAS